MSASDGLRRDLGLLEATSVVVGSMIGVGIFLGPDRIAALVQTPALILLVWVLGGLFVFCGALTYAELGATLPEAGGQYAYLREAYGPLAAFLNGWSAFLVGKSASVSALVVGFAAYLGTLTPLPILWEGSWRVGAYNVQLYLSAGTLVAIALILAVTALNIVGVRHAGRLQNATLVAKLGTLAILVIGGIALLTHAIPGVAAQPLAPPELPSWSALSGAFLLALIPAFFAYDGWVNSTQVAEEVKNPTRNVPRSLVLGVLTVMGAYALTNLVYVLAGAQTSAFAAADVASLLAGGSGRTLITIAILLSILGTVNAVTMSGPRITYAMARDGLFFKGTSRVHPRYGTPAKTILAQAIVSILLVLAPPVGGRPLFDTLLTYIIFNSFIFYALGAAAVFTLRKKRPDLPRPYKTPLYPLPPILFIALTGIFLVNTLIQLPLESLMGLALIASGIPFYAHWKKRARQGETATTETIADPPLAR